MKTFPKQLLPLFILTALALVGSLHATPLTWDADPSTASPQDGAGVWDTTTNTWWDGAANVTWNNATPDSAIFGTASGAAGIVSNSLPITVGNLTFNPTGSGTYTLSGSAANTVTLSGNPTITANANAALNVVLTGTAFTKEGSGQVSLRPPANNTYTGVTLVNNGILALNSGTAGRILIPGDLTINSGATVTNTGLNNPIADTSTVTVNSGGTYSDGGDTIGTLVLAGGTVIQTGTKSLVANVDARSGAILEAAGATGKLDGNLTKSTTGTVTLFSPSSATAAGLTNTTVNAGNLVLDYTQTFGKLNDTVGTLTINGGTVIFTNYGNAETVAAFILAGGVITNTAGTTDLRLPAGGSFDVRSGAAYMILGGTGRGLTKSTSGTVILAADNTYTGGTLISAGILQIGDGGTTGLPGSATADITNNATLVFNRSGALVNLSGTISGTGSIIKMGGGTLGLTASDNSYTGSTTISNGTINISGTSKLGDGTGALILSGGTLNTTASRTASTDPIANPLFVTDDSAITTTNPGVTVFLNFTNDSISGSGGTLTFRNDAASGTGTFVPRFSGSGFNFSRPLVITNGSFGTTRLDSYNTTGTTQTFSGPISGDGGYRRNATLSGTGGTTIFSGNNTYTGPTDLRLGLLVVNGSLGTNTVTVGSTATLGGNGTINGPVFVQTSGTLSAGTGIGQLTISNTLTFQNTCTNVAELDKAAHTNDLVRGISTLTYAGTLVVTNLSGTLAANDTFKLFDAAIYTGNFASSNLPALGAGLSWDTTGLTTTGTIRITGTAVNTPQIGAASLSGNHLILAGTGGTAGADYHVLTSTNAALPLAGWRCIATNQFITGGNFNFTNAIDPLTPSQFYMLKVP